MSGLFGCIFGGSSLSAGSHTVAFAIAKDYGYVILVAVISSFLLMWQAMQVNYFHCFLSRKGGVAVVIFRKSVLQIL